MFQTILIGYDGAERGGEAAALADALRDPHTGTLLLTSAYPLTHPPAAEETVEMLAQARDGLRKPDRVRIRAVASDSPGRALSEMAETEDADLVVVGAGHRSALGRPLPGTAAERLLGEPPCPVAVAPRGYSSGDVRRIGVAFDGSPAGYAAVRTAESLALALGASLTVYDVAGTGGIDAPRGCRTETLLISGVPAEEIAGRAYGVIDLLLVGACDHGPLARALLGNVSGALVREAGCPVMVIPQGGPAARPPATVVAGARA